MRIKVVVVVVVMVVVIVVVIVAVVVVAMVTLRPRAQKDDLAVAASPKKTLRSTNGSGLSAALSRRVFFDSLLVCGSWSREPKGGASPASTSSASSMACDGGSDGGSDGGGGAGAERGSTNDFAATSLVAISCVRVSCAVAVAVAVNDSAATSLVAISCVRVSCAVAVAVAVAVVWGGVASSSVRCPPSSAWCVIASATNSVTAVAPSTWGSGPVGQWGSGVVGQ